MSPQACCRVEPWQWKLYGMDENNEQIKESVQSSVDIYIDKGSHRALSVHYGVQPAQSGFVSFRAKRNRIDS